MLKFIDKITNICQGDLVLSQHFLNNMMLCMLPDLKPKIGATGLGQKPIDATKKTNDSITLACQNLWQSFRTKLFNNYSNKGLNCLVEWLFNNLVSLAEHSDCLSQVELQKLTILLDLIELIATSLTIKSQNRKQTNQEAFNSESDQNRKSLIKLNNIPLHSLELYILINPLLYWLDYSIEKLDRLPLFKSVWRTLTKTLEVFPPKKLNIDIVTIIMPVLQKINTFCQNSSPPQEMLSFLLLVFEDFKKLQIKNPLKRFLFDLVKTLAKCIPHHLHDEVFQVCEVLLDLMREHLTNGHIQVVITALIDKYTMRSKYQKQLTQFFIDLILDQSVSDIKVKTDKRLSEQQFNQGIDVPGVDQNHHQDEIDNYEYERESYHYMEADDDEDQMDQEQIVIQQQREIHSNQDYIGESPLSQRLLSQQQIPNPPSQWHHNNQSLSHQQLRHTNVHLLMDFKTLFDKLCDICLFDNNYIELANKFEDVIQLELYHEKLALFLQVIKSMNQKHMCLFQRFLNRENFLSSCVRLYQNSKSQLNLIEIQEQLSTYYMQNCAPKNLYEHPIHLLNQQVHGSLFGNVNNFNNNNQTSQSSGGQLAQFNMRESSRISYMSVQPRIQQYGLVPNIGAGNLGQTHPVLHQGLLRQRQHQDLEDELMLNQDIHDVICDELDLINKERIILIQLNATIIRMSVEQFNQTQDAYSQFHALNMIDNLFTNLMPVPNFQNIVIKQMLHRSRNQNIQQNLRADFTYNEIPDLEKLVIVPNTYPQHQNMSVSSQQHNCILSEFECFDLKYLHARLQFALKLWPFLEQSITQNSWNNIKSMCYGVICQVLKIDITDYKQQTLNKLKQVLFPLISKLLNSKESEAKAGGLNILGSLLGLGHDFQTSIFNEGKIKLIENKQEFKKCNSFVSLAIWQQVFNLQEDWDITIREASSVLIQVCAPRESIQHFHSIQKDQYNLKLTSLINTFNAASSQNIRQRQYQGIDTGVVAEHTRSIEALLNKRKVSMTQQQTDILSDQSEEEKINDLEQQEDDNLSVLSSDSYFYADSYNEEQLKEIVSIFKVDYKPPKALWIEKQGFPSQTQQLEEHQEQQEHIYDVFEDNFVDKLNNKNKVATAFSEYFKNKQEEKKQEDYLIFERHFDSDTEEKQSKSQKKEEQILIDGINQDELGIIDLDEAGDDFDELDDDKLPILKNTYKKKNRPNNSKSVAIGSKSQDSQIVKHRQHLPEEQEPLSNDKKGQVITADIKQHQEPKNEELSIESLDLVEDNGDSSDDIIEQYENMISNSIKELNSNLKIQEPTQTIAAQQENQDSCKATVIGATVIAKQNKSFDGTSNLQFVHSPIRLVGQHEVLLSLFDKKEEQKPQKHESAQKQPTQIVITNVCNPKQQQPKKINDPSQNMKKTYSQQASRLKKLMPLTVKKEIPKQQSQNLSLNSPNNTKASIQSHMNKGNAQKDVIRKRKTELQRKSELPLMKRSYQYQGQNQQQSDLAQSKSLEKYQSTQPSQTIAQKKHHTLMQQAKQVFVSRAKSQSYLNTVMAIGNNNQPASTQKQNKVKKGSFNSYIKQENVLINASKQRIHNIAYNSVAKNQQVNKGYFSNDECEVIANQKSPEHKKNKLSFSSEEAQVLTYKTSSQKVQRRKNDCNPANLSDDQSDHEHSNFKKNLNNQLEEDSMEQEIIGAGDNVDEFWSGDESLAGGKQLSSIEEEEDSSGKKHNLIRVNNFVQSTTSPQSAHFKRSQESI